MGAPRAVVGETSFHTLLAAFRSRNCGGAYPRALCRHPAPVPASGTPGAVPAARRAWHHCSLPCPPPAERSCPLGLSHTPITPQSAALMVATSGRSMAAPLSTHWRLQRVAPACSASPCRANPWPHTRPGNFPELTQAFEPRSVPPPDPLHHASASTYSCSINWRSWNGEREAEGTAEGEGAVLPEALQRALVVRQGSC